MSCEDCATNFDLAYDMVTDRYADLLAAAVAAMPICRDYFENYLSIAVREEEGGNGFTCDACGCFSTNGERHLDDCEAGDAMVAYNAIRAAIKKAKGQQ
jgi:hypothetical protein